MIYIIKRYMPVVLCLGVFVLLQSDVCNARTINIPGEYTTIQAGIDAAVDGDVILVANGTYTGPKNRNLNFKGKAITIQSKSGPGSTIIDCQNSGRGILFRGEGAESRFIGFTIKNGHVDDLSPFGGKGGGIFCVDASPTISNCIISHCVAEGYGGGGIALYTSSPKIENTILEYNSTSTVGGGLLINEHSAPKVINCIIRHNKTFGASSGGGVGVVKSEPTISYCTITYNDSNTAYAHSIGNLTNSGGISFRKGSTGILASSVIMHNKAQERGGIGSWNAAPTITNCMIAENEATVDGGGGIGLYSNSNAIVSRCTIQNNTAAQYGAGISIWNETASVSGPSFLDCIIDNNRVLDPNGGAGGLNAYNASVKMSRCILRNNRAATRAGLSLNGTTGSTTLSVLVNNLIYNNIATGFGGGITCLSGAGASITNCTVVANRSGSDSGGLFVDSSSVSAVNSIFWANIPTDSLTTNAHITYSDVGGGYAGTGNINSNPLFVGPADFHLTDPSPCVNSGNSAASNVPIDDLGGNVRSDISVDMGSYEFPYTVGGPGVSGSIGADIASVVSENGGDGIPSILPLLLGSP